MSWEEYTKGYLYFSCRDVGRNCGFMVRAEKEEELIKAVSSHGCRKHHICEITPEVKARIQSNIKRFSI